MSARDHVRVGDDGLPEGTVLLADKADLLKTMGQTPAAARGRVSGRVSGSVEAGGRHAVGNAVYHTTGDRLEAVKRLALDFEAAYQDIGHQVGTLPYEGSAERVKAHPNWYMWWQSNAAPLFAEWTKFKAEQTPEGWSGPAPSYVALGERFKTDWPVYTHWHDRLVTLRNGARQIGMKLTSAEPGALPTTFAEDVADVAKGAVDAGKKVLGGAWDVGKVVLYGGLALAGAFGVALVVNEFRGRPSQARKFFS